MRALVLLLAFLPQASAQDIKLDIFGGHALPAIAVPDLNGSGAAHAHMAAFNETVAADLEDSGAARFRSKSLYPKTQPAQPSDVRPGDWTSPPVSASYLGLGYGAIQAGQSVFRGYLIDFSPNPPLIAAIYRGAASEAGARKAAHEFAADIIRKLGGQPLLGTKIFFRSKRGGNTAIWSMDPDGGDQRQLTQTRNLIATLGVSPEGDAFAFTEWSPFPKLSVWSADPPRPLRFENPAASLVTTASFTPDGRQILYAVRRGGRAAIYIANRDGSAARQLSESAGADVEPKVNPKGGTVAFVSDRSGPPQVYTMNLDGGDLNRITSGEGEAVNPAWHPKGEILAFAWTRGPIPGKFNIFVMPVAQREPVLLTHEGRNENPSWAPDGAHLVFCSTRSGSPQIWTMLADGTHLRQLTTQGANDMPVWSAR